MAKAKKTSFEEEVSYILEGHNLMIEKMEKSIRNISIALWAVIAFLATIIITTVR